MVLKDVSVKENYAKMCVFRKYSLHIQGLNYRKVVYELEDHVG